MIGNASAHKIGAKTWSPSRGIFDKETRRKPLAFAADAAPYGVWKLLWYSLAEQDCGRYAKASGSRRGFGRGSGCEGRVESAGARVSWVLETPRRRRTSSTSVARSCAAPSGRIKEGPSGKQFRSGEALDEKHASAAFGALPRCRDLRLSRASRSGAGTAAQEFATDRKPSGSPTVRQKTEVADANEALR